MDTDPKTLSAGNGTVELALLGSDGAPSRLTMSAGMERFIGIYPRVDGLSPAGQLLRYKKA